MNKTKTPRSYRKRCPKGSRRNKKTGACTLNKRTTGGRRNKTSRRYK